MEFSRLVELKKVRKETGVPVKIKLLLLHVVVITHLMNRQTGTWLDGWKDRYMEKRINRCICVHRQSLIGRKV